MLKVGIQDAFCLQLNLILKCCKCLEISDGLGMGEGILYFDGSEVPLSFYAVTMPASQDCINFHINTIA